MSYRRAQGRREESIYDLIPQKEAAQEKPKRYVSKYPHDTPPTASTFGPSTASTTMTTNIAGHYDVKIQNHKWKNSGSNFGTSEEHYADPTNFLKKNTKETLPEPRKFSYQNTRKPPVVKNEEIPVMGKSSQTNFVRENALSAIMAEPPKPKGSEPRYMKKADFGKVPKYLDDVKAEVAAEKEYIQENLHQEMYTQQQPQMTLLPEQERVKLLAQLKAKWEQVDKKYQNMTHIVALDTVGKVRRKEDYESQLQQLEQNIERLKKPFVFVQQDHNPYY